MSVTWLFVSVRCSLSRWTTTGDRYVENTAALYASLVSTISQSTGEERKNEGRTVVTIIWQWHGEFYILNIDAITRGSSKRRSPAWQEQSLAWQTVFIARNAILLLLYCCSKRANDVKRPCERPRQKFPSPSLRPPVAVQRWFTLSLWLRGITSSSDFRRMCVFLLV